MDRRRHPRISLDLLRGFHAAARHLSFTRAARELCVTQPAVSREIKTLEEQIGQPLFRRVNRTLQLTQAGAELSRCADEVFGVIDATLARLKGSGITLAVTMPVPFASLWLGRRLTQFTRLHPEIALRIAASNDIDNLKAEQLDVAIRFLPLGMEVPGSQWLVDYKLFPVCSAAVLHDSARPLRTYADIRNHVLVDFDTMIDGRRWSDWENWSGAMGLRTLRPSRLLRLAHYDQVIQAVATDSGIAIGKWPHLTRELQDGTLRAPFGSASVACLGSFHIILAPGAAARAEVIAFVAWLNEQVREDAERMQDLICDTGPATRVAR